MRLVGTSRVESSASGHLIPPVLNPREIAELAFAAGWHDLHDLSMAVAVSFAECDGYVHSYNDNLDDTGKVTSRDVGAWQINIPASAIGTAREDHLYDPASNAVAAYAMWVARGWKPWSSFTSGVCFDDTYVLRALLGVMNFAAEAMVYEQIKRPDRTAHHTISVPVVSTSQLHHLYRSIPLG